VGWAVGGVRYGDARRALQSSTARARRLTRSQERPVRLHDGGLLALRSVD
jgi:hypothetical protein